MRQYQRRNQMNKLKQNKTNPLDKVVKDVEKYTDIYDNVVVDGNEIKLESQLRKEIEEREKKRKIPSWMIMKQVAQDKARKGNTKELNDLLKIYQKKQKEFNQTIILEKKKYSLKILNILNPIITEYVEKNKINLVVDKKNILIGIKTLDITKNILELINNYTKDKNLINEN